MKNVSNLTSLAVAVFASVCATGAMAAPKDTPVDDWATLLTNVELIIDKSTGIETGVNGVQGSVDGLTAKVDAISEVGINGVQNSINGVQSSVDGLTADVANVQAGIDGLTQDVANVQNSVNGLTQDVASVQSGVNGVQGGVDGLTLDVANVQSGVNGVQGSVDGLADSISALESLVAGLAGDGPLTEHANGAETLSSNGSQAFDRWVYGDYTNPKHVSLTLQARGMDNTDYVEVWTRVHPSDSTDWDKNVRYVFGVGDFAGPSWVQQIEFDAIEWAIQIYKNDTYDNYPSSAINLTWAATVSSPDSQNGAQSVASTGSNAFNRTLIGDYADPKHVSLTLQARGVDNTDYVEVWARLHPNDSTDLDKNIRYVFGVGDFSGPAWIQQIEFDAIEWAIQIYKNDTYDDYPSSAINLTWAATTD